QVARFVGEAVAVVVADSRYRAEDALELIEVDYEPLALVVDAEMATRDGAPQVHPDVPGNRYVARDLAVGPVDQAFAEADVVLDWRRFESPRYSGVPIETRGVAAAPTEEGRIAVWTSTQVPHRVQEVIARSLGIAEAEVRVVVPDVGGGFGTKAQVYPEEVVVAWLARTLKGPVKWVEDRREHLLAAGHARQQVVEARLAATRNGVVTAIDARVLCDVGAYGVYPFGTALEAHGTSSMIPGPYRIQAYRCRVRAVATNKSPGGPYRGVGLPVSTLVHERLMDILARELGLAPDEVRRRNLVPADAFPYTSATGMVYDSGSYVECLDRAVAELGLEGWRKRQAEVNGSDGAVRLGIGLACYVEYTGVGAPAYRARGMLSVPGFDATRLRVEPDGSVLVASSISEIGQGVQTTLRQLAADGLGLPLEAIRFANTDTDVAPAGTGTFASRSAVLGAGSVGAACRRLRARIMDAAAAELEVGPADLELSDGRVRVRGVPDRAIALGELAARHGACLDVSERYDGPPATFAHATHAAVMEVDLQTGQSRFLDYVVVEDCGRLINPLVVDGQIQGAVAQGLGGALLEELRYDEQGQLLTASLMDYLLPTATDLPNLRVLHLETPAPLVPGGFKGVGEGGTLASPAVVAN
ncbi:MAG TPA: molybdopterin cofactor-binding domain-containing protein, partial [Chloroflexota bacterium]|nr:molybdopterin cofactor-binding domain-containing protein [Chloroflexota bacterium]